MKWETDVEFCPDMGALSIDSMAKMIAEGVFSSKSFADVLKVRYRKMQKNFTNVGYADSEWDVKVGNVSCLNVASPKRDARLSVPKSLVAPSNETISGFF